MDRHKIVTFVNVVASIGRQTLAFEEGLVAIKLVLWTMEQMKLERAGEREDITPEELSAKCDELIREVEGG